MQLHPDAVQRNTAENTRPIRITKANINNRANTETKEQSKRMMADRDTESKDAQYHFHLRADQNE